MCKERREEVESDASTHYVVDVWSCSWGEQYTLKQSFSSRTTQSFICRRVIKDNASQGCSGRSLIGINLDGIMLGEFCFRSLRLRNEMNQREREKKKDLKGEALCLNSRWPYKKVGGRASWNADGVKGDYRVCWATSRHPFRKGKPKKKRERAVHVLLLRPNLPISTGLSWRISWC